MFIYLNWNLLLALIPLLFAMLIRKYNLQGIKFWIALLGWMLFFPNAPYLITDLMYLAKIKQHTSIPLWFDIIMLSSFAINGLLLGYVSSQIIFKKFQQLYSKWIANFFTISYLMFSGYGIYLGRFSRYNSWDIITNPEALFSSVWQTLLHPIHYKSVYILSILFGTLVCLVFYSLHETIEPQKDLI
ncbi:MAG: hypothetical protein RJA07_1189 [Bacteroidota bacterium]|jgi:uncharacterized membrane protein